MSCWGTLLSRVPHENLTFDCHCLSLLPVRQTFQAIYAGIGESDQHRPDASEFLHTHER